ncbi:hypothetical protein [Salarchaeum japonicum]|uniref:hypothetical protein n=1 Tax=Salarchaeum japonicum TaxID=555573 RepID=UPI003C715ECB
MSNKKSNHKVPTNSSINGLKQVRKRVVSHISDALTGNDAVLLEALPATGKSRGLVKAIEQTGEAVTVFTQRGRKEQYAQYKQWCDAAGLSCKVIPSADETCPTFQGDYGEDQQRRVQKLRNAGGTPRRIHRHVDPPCKTEGDCPYENALDFTPADYDVLVGHPTHAYVKRYLENRIPVYDEFPAGAYLEKIPDTPSAITDFLGSHNLPYQDFHDLLNGRTDPARRRKALRKLSSTQLMDEKGLFQEQSPAVHKLAGLCVLTLLEGEDLGNGWEQAILGKWKVGVYDQGNADIYILNPPDLPETILGLDGTPTESMWNIALGLYDRRQRRLNPRTVLNKRERREYITEIQNIRIIPTTTHVRPYSGVNTNPKRDAALLHEVEMSTDGDVGVISSRQGIDDVKSELDSFGNWKSTHFGNLIGSNNLGNVETGVILGSTHYGDEFVKRWGALAGESIKSNGKQGLKKSYGEFGDEILRHMREHRVLQALFRFGRMGTPTTVYVDTAAMPNWIPVEANPRDTNITPWKSAETRFDILTHLQKQSQASTGKISKKVGCSSQYVRDVLNGYAKKGIVEKRERPHEPGGAIIWVDQSSDAINPYGEVVLPDHRKATRYSKLRPYSNTKERVGNSPPPSLGSLRKKREQKKMGEAQKRMRRWSRQNEMERWYWS